MLLMAENLISKTPGGDLMFFQTAYIWCFGKQGEIFPDLLEYRRSRKLPVYVKKYVEYIDSLEGD